MDRFDYPSLISVCSVVQWAKSVFWFSIVVFCTSEVLRNILNIDRKNEETSFRVHIQCEMRVLHIRCGRVVRDFESEAKTRCNFQFR
jgi:hypothetical protein